MRSKAALLCRALKPHPRFAEIQRELQKYVKKGVPFSGVCYRCTEPQFAGQIASGIGSQLYGARWTPKSSFPTVYLCDTAEAALQEYLARGRRMKIPDYKSLPMVMAGIRVKVQNLFDTTDAAIAGVIKAFLDSERIHWRAIQDRREAVSQAIGRAVQEICFSGLIVWSQALPECRNIVVFPKKLSSAEILSAPNLKAINVK